jgi:hypothetical protein
MKVVRQRQEMTIKIEKMVKNLINKVWKNGVEDEVVRQRQEMIRKIEKMVKN